MGENFLFMPNHQSTADVPLCMTIFASRVGFCDKVMWIMDKVFKLTNFGWVAWMHDDFFILAVRQLAEALLRKHFCQHNNNVWFFQGKYNREKSLVDLRSHLKEAFITKERKYLVLFPEGGFLRKRKEVSQR